MKNLCQILSASLNQILRIGDHTDAGDAVFERDIPEPTVAAFGRAQNERCAAVEIRLAMRAFEVGVKNCFPEFRIAHAATELVCKHRRLPGGINYYRRVKLLD